MPANHTQLEWAVMQTVAYSDVFHFPVTCDEIQRYLIGSSASIEAIQATVNDLIDRHALTQNVNYISLPNRDANVQMRVSRAALSAEMWPIAVHYGAIIGNLPFVRMVAVTGSLAAENINPQGDIDYMIVTAPDRLWLTRLFVIAWVHLAAHTGVTLCPNYLVTENALTIEDRNLFTARELVQMVPVTGLHVYQQMRQHNAWTSAFFPNATDAPPRTDPAIDDSTTRQKRGLELLLNTPASTALDRWEMRRKIRKFARQHSIEANFSPDWCKGHFDGHMQRILDSYQTRLDALETPPERICMKGQPVTKILFGQSYYLQFDRKLWEAMQPYPPLGTLYAASYVRERGYDVTLFDAMLAESEHEWQTMLQQEKPSHAVIYEDNFNYLSKMCLTRMREAAFTMIGMAKAQGCTVIVCGSDASDHYTDYLEAGADYVLIGEGEETLGELLDALEQDVPVHGIAGAVTAETVLPVRRDVMKSLDALPMPAWDLIDVERYKRIWMERHGYFSMNLATTRGCPYHCNWCAKPIWGQRYNVHNPAYIVEQMRYLQAHYQPDHIWFADDIMGLKPGWMETFADLVEAEGVKLPFKCLSRADLLLRGETIPALKRAGCDIIWIGAESGSQKILDAMEKGTRVEQIRQAAHELRKNGVRVGFFLQFGYPGESRADIAKTLDLVRECMPDDIGISVSYPLPGTKFHQRVENQLGERHNWQDSNDMAMLYEGPFTTAFYRQLHTVIHKEFRARQTLRNFRKFFERPRKQLRDTAAMIYHTLSMPLARFKLNRLAQQTGGGTVRLSGGMDYNAAATPTPQADDQVK